MRHHASLPRSEWKMVAKWIPERGRGYSAGYAVPAVLLSFFGYFAMIPAH
jgi:hypothetical protein